MSSEDNYIPGVCNIGNEQLTKRKRFLAICISFTVLCLVLIEIFHAGRSARLYMFVPFAVCTVAAQQVIYKFCYRFGLTGLYGFGKVGYDKKVPENHFRELDRKKSRKMILTGIFVGIGATLIYYYLPF